MKTTPTRKHTAPDWLPSLQPTEVHTLNLGAGVQSSTLALMAAHGLITPHLKEAVFADTHDEPAAVYDWIVKLEALIAAAPHPYPITRVTAGSLSAEALTPKTRADGTPYYRNPIPTFLRVGDRPVGKLPGRGCTRDYKIRPILRHLKQTYQVPHKHPVPLITQWLGISLDELQRAKQSDSMWTQHRWPLIEMRMTRLDCLDWLTSNGFPVPPRSACVYCPFRADAEWREMRDTAPDDWRRACDFDDALRATREGTENLDARVYIHRSGQPLAVAPIDPDDNDRHLELWDWRAECDGVCGV